MFHKHPTWLEDMHQAHLPQFTTETAASALTVRKTSNSNGMQEESDGAGSSESSAYVAVEDHQALPIPSGFYFVDSNGFHNLS